MGVQEVPKFRFEEDRTCTKSAHQPFLHFFFPPVSASFWGSVCRWLRGQEPCCPSRQPGCESQDPQPVVPGPTSGLHKHCMCVAQTHACRQSALTHKIKINKAFFFKCFILKRLLSLCLPAPVWYENPNSSYSEPDHVSCPPLPPLDIVPLVTNCLCLCSVAYSGTQEQGAFQMLCHPWQGAVKHPSPVNHFTQTHSAHCIQKG